MAASAHPSYDANDAKPSGLAATEREIRCMVEDRCSPTAIGLYAITRLEAHAAAISEARRALLDAALTAPAWSPLADPAVRASLDGYLRSTSRSTEVGRRGPALDLHRREAEAFTQRMELVLQRYGSPLTAATVRRAVVASATNIALAALAERYLVAGFELRPSSGMIADTRLLSDHAYHAGEAICAAYGQPLTLRDRISQWRKPKSLPTTQLPSVGSLLGDVGAWAVDLTHTIERAERMAPDFGAMVALEAMMPPSGAVQNHDTIGARVAAFREFESQLAGVERAERAYIMDVTAREGHHTASPRPPIVNVAQLVTYRRIRNHADPLTVVRTNLDAVGIDGAMQVARAGEIALARRYDELCFDRLQGANGDVYRRPAGFDLHPRYRAEAQRAVETQAVEKFLTGVLPSFRDGERDPEFLRIDRYVSRLVEADLVRTAIGIIRPLTRGELIEEPKWPGRVASFAVQLFDETEGQRPLLDAGGEMVDWQELVRRHPDARSSGERRVSAPPATAEPSWIAPAVEDREAYARPSAAP